MDRSNLYGGCSFKYVKASAETMMKPEYQDNFCQWLSDFAAGKTKFPVDADLYSLMEEALDVG